MEESSQNDTGTDWSGVNHVLTALSTLAETTISESVFKEAVLNAADRMGEFSEQHEWVSRKHFEHLDNWNEGSENWTKLHQSYANWQSQLTQSISRISSEIDNYKKIQGFVEEFGKKAGFAGKGLAAFDLSDAVNEGDSIQVGENVLGLVAGAAAAAAVSALASGALAAIGAGLLVSLVLDKVIDQIPNEYKEWIGEVAIGAWEKVGELGSEGFKWLWENTYLDEAGAWLGRETYHLVDSIHDFFFDSQSWRPRRRNSPIALDLDNDGLETTAESGWSGPLFDHNGDGIKQATGWLSADDALLVLDRNGNGLIDNGQELFGDSTPLQGGGTAEHGYAALAELDGNGDGVVDASDAQFADLRLWRDLNQDGISQANELSTLDELGVASIDTAFTATNILNNGNRIPYISHFTRADGSTGTTGDIFFAISKFHTEFAAQVEPTALTTDLPDIHGSGAVRNLRDAASRSDALASVLTQYSTANRDGQMELIDTLISTWAATSGMKSMVDRAEDENSIVLYEFGNLISLSDQEVVDALVTMDGNGGSGIRASITDAMTLESRAGYQKWSNTISVLERFNSEEFVSFDRPRPTNPFTTIDIGSITTSGVQAIGEGYNFTRTRIHQAQLDLLEQSYIALRDSIYKNLVVQTRLRPYLDAIGLRMQNGQIALDFTELEALFDSRFNSNDIDAAWDLVDLVESVGAQLKEEGWHAHSYLANGLHTRTFDVSLDAINIMKTMGVHIAATDDGETLEATTAIPDLIGRDGADTLIGNTAANQLYGYAGNDTIDGGSGNDTLNGGSGNDTIDGGYGNDTLNGGAGDDVLTGNRGQDTLNGGEGNDELIVHSYDSNTLDGGAGDDLLRVQREGIPNTVDNYSNIMRGGTGNDRLEGYYGAESYHFDRGDGRDVINDLGYSNDKLVFGEGISVSDLVVNIVGDDLEIRIRDSANPAADDRILIENWYSSSSHRIEQWHFADGTTIHSHNLAGLHIGAGTSESDDMIDVSGIDYAYGIAGLGGDDTITTGSGHDLVDGGAGNDTIDGGYGNDTLNGGAGDDVLTGNRGQDTLNGGEGNDELIVHSYDSNTLDGGAGDDVLRVLRTGSASLVDNYANVMRGGTGNDRLEGYYGAESYHFDRGDGRDVINDLGYSNDKLVFGEGISVSDLVLHRDGGALVIALYADGVETADRITVENWFVGATHRIEQFTFADGSTMSPQTLIDQGMRIHGTDGADTLTGTPGDDLVDGGLGNDLLTGSDGNDRYRFSAGSGQDQLDIQGTAGADVVSYGEGVTADELWFSRSGNDLLVSVLESNDSLSIKNWYGDDESAQPARFEVDTGEVLMRNQVEQLINAVAAFAPPVAGALNLDPDQQTQYQQIIATHWRPDS